MIISEIESHSDRCQCHHNVCHYKSFIQCENFSTKCQNELLILFLQPFLTFFHFVALLAMGKCRLCVWEKPPRTPVLLGSIDIATGLPLWNHMRKGNSLSSQDNCFHSPVVPTVENSLQCAKRILVVKVYNATTVPYGYNIPHSCYWPDSKN